MVQFILVGIILLALQLSLFAIAGYFIYANLKKEFQEIAGINGLNKIPAEIEKVRVSTASIEEELTISLSHLKPAITELRKTAEDFRGMQDELRETHGVAKSASLLLTKVANRANNKEVR